MKRFIVLLIISFFFSGCTPGIGLGIGGFTSSGNGIAASEVQIDSQTGVHGSVSMGTGISL